MAHSKNNNSVRLGIHSVTSDSLEVSFTNFGDFISLSIGVNNHDITLFIDDPNEIDSVLSKFRNPQELDSRH